MSTVISAMKGERKINPDGMRGVEESFLEIRDAIYKCIYLCMCVGSI